MLGSSLNHYNVVVGNGRGGESIYGGFFEGKAAAMRIVGCDPMAHCLKMAVQSYAFPSQMKALLSNTTRNTCCLWPTGAKIQMVHSFSCKDHVVFCFFYTPVLMHYYLISL